MRERTTWTRDMIKQASAKTADPYLMNQDHVKEQPAADKYVNGDPSSWAEDVHPSKDTWEAEYANGQVKRDEIGLPEMRSDTFNHPEKTAAEKALLVKKANVAVRVARMMLGSKATEASVEDQAYALMHVPDAELVKTFNRLADDGQQQEQQSQQVQSADQQMQMQAEQQMQSQMEQCKAALQAGDDEGFKAALQAMAQAQQTQAQQQVQQQGQQTQTAVEQQAPMQQQSQQVQQQVQQQTAVEQQQADQQLLDDMLMDAPGAPGMSEMDIELEAPSMDVGDDQLGPEDDVLKTLFAADEDQEQGQQEQGQKQAGMSRTASTRTVGTRPSGGVSKIGGGTAGGGTRGEDRLASLWQTAPDVKNAFGL